MRFRQIVSLLALISSVTGSSVVVEQQVTTNGGGNEEVTERSLLRSSTSKSSSSSSSSSSNSLLSSFSIFDDYDDNDEYGFLDEDEYYNKVEEHQQYVTKLNERTRKLQSSNPRVIAEAYECHEDNTPIENSKQKNVGDEVRICIGPNFPTLKRQVYIRKIQKFIFAKDYGIGTQEVIKKGIESDTDFTLQLCFPGSTVCAFKTKLRDDFFYGDTNGTITGSGEVQMQFGRSITNRRRRLVTVPFQLNTEFSISSSDSSSSMDDTTTTSNDSYESYDYDFDSMELVYNKEYDRDLQQLSTAQNNFAGFTGVRIKLDVGWSKAPRNYMRSTVTKLHWWYDSPLWVRILIIIWLILMFLFGCGVCCWFLFCPGGLFVRRDQDEKRTVRETHEEIHEEDTYRDAPPPRRNDDTWQKYSTSDFTKNDDRDYQDDDVQPTDFDVCFDAEDHPGTESFDKAVTKAVERFGEHTEYSPPVYRAIKKELPGRKFFVCDDENRPDDWREVGKRELIEIFKQKFDEKKDEKINDNRNRARDRAREKNYDDQDDDNNNRNNNNNNRDEDTYGDDTRDDTYNDSYNNNSYNDGTQDDTYDNSYNNNSYNNNSFRGVD